MNELSLFSGAGGGLLGTKLLGWKHIGYVEFNEYCQKIIRQRIEDGILDEAPIFSDIRAFIDQGYAEAYQGMVDVITAGFPCQPFSVAGKGLGADDPRNMWPTTIECIRIIRPRYCLLENVPGLLAHAYTRRIFGDLAEAGYDAKWCVLGADDVGANHRRKRLWIMAHAKSSECERAGIPRRGRDGFTDKGFKMADTKRMRKLQPKGSKQNKWGRIGNCSENVADTISNGSQGSGTKRKIKGQARLCDREGSNEEQDVSDPESKQAGGIFKLGISANAGAGSNRAKEAAWWTTEPDVGRVANGVASRVDRLKAIGNGQVPAVVRAAWMILNGD